MRNADARQQARIGLRFQRHQLGFRIGCLQPVLQRGDAWRTGSWRRTASPDRRAARCGLSMFLNAATRWRGCRSCAPRPKIAVVMLGISGDRRECPDGGRRSRSRMALTGRLRDEAGQRGRVGALQHGHGLLARQRRDQLRLGEGLQQLDRDDADFLALAAQIGDDASRTSSVTEPRPTMTVSASSHE